MSGGHPYALVSVAGAFGRWGRQEAAAILRELSERAQRTCLPWAQLINIADAAGRRNLAVSYSERAWSEREPLFILFARHAPECHAIRAEARFQAILHEMGAPIEDRRRAGSVVTGRAFTAPRRRA